MSNDEIKNAVNIEYEAIKLSNEKLAYLRSVCKHEKQEECNYSYRIGSILPAIVCSTCGELIKFTFDYIIKT